jgi:hypothetical protein
MCHGIGVFIVIELYRVRRLFKGKAKVSMTCLTSLIHFPRDPKHSNAVCILLDK